MLTCPENLCQTRGVSLAPNWPACSQKVFPGCSHSHQVSVIHHLNELRSVPMPIKSFTCLLKKTMDSSPGISWYITVDILWLSNPYQDALWHYGPMWYSIWISQLSPSKKSPIWGCHHRGDGRRLASHGTASGDGWRCKCWPQQPRKS